jgi:hypothetical protein
VCRGRVLAVDLGRTRVGVLGGIEISLIGDFSSVEPLHNEIAICDFPIESEPSIMRDACQEIRRGIGIFAIGKSTFPWTSARGNPSENPNKI